MGQQSRRRRDRRAPAPGASVVAATPDDSLHALASQLVKTKQELTAQLVDAQREITKLHQAMPTEGMLRALIDEVIRGPALGDIQRVCDDAALMLNRLNATTRQMLNDEIAQDRASREAVPA